METVPTSDDNMMKKNGYSLCRQFAVEQLLLPDGSRLMRQVLYFDAVGNLLHRETLSEELPFMEWRKGVWRVGEHGEVERMA